MYEVDAELSGFIWLISAQNFENKLDHFEHITSYQGKHFKQLVFCSVFINKMRKFPFRVLIIIFLIVFHLLDFLKIGQIIVFSFQLPLIYIWNTDTIHTPVFPIINMFAIQFQQQAWSKQSKTHTFLSFISGSMPHSKLYQNILATSISIMCHYYIQIPVLGGYINLDVIFDKHLLYCFLHLTVFPSLFHVCYHLFLLVFEVTMKKIQLYSRICFKFS